VVLELACGIGKILFFHLSIFVFLFFFFKIREMKKILISILGITLMGCESPVVLNTSETTKFKINETIFSVFLPDGWQKQIIENQNEVIFNAVKNRDSFVILQRINQIESENAVAIIFESAKNDFFYFEEKSFSEKNKIWVFNGKIENTSNLEVYYQKIIPILNTDFFLIASCASEDLEINDCDKIINNFEIVE
jgi:hypothetical protein